MIKRIQPSELMDSPAFSQAIEVTASNSTLYIGGQNAVNASGEIVGIGNFSLQCVQALKNIAKILNEAGYEKNNVVKWNIYMVEGNDPREGFGAFQEVFGIISPPPAITVVQVSGLARPGILVEIEAVAVK